MHQKLNIYLACIQDANGDGECDGPFGPNPGGPGPAPGPNPPSPTPDPDVPPDPYDPDLVQSSDPNDIIGPEGFGTEHWVAGSATLPYMIRFENEAIATAPAQRVVVTQQLDPDLDFRTFRVDDFGWGGFRVELTAIQSFFQGRVDLPDSTGIDVDATVSIDIETGLVTWILQTVNPTSGEAPSDALAGFLPPNDSEGIGEGFVTYTVRAKAHAPTGSMVDAQAEIVFDQNEPIDTPPIFNTIDSGVPTSAVQPLPASQREPEFMVLWSGADDEGGSALKSFDVFVSDDGGPFTTLLSATSLNEAPFVGEPGHTYAFYSIARDNAGNVEGPPATPDAQITILTDNTAPSVIPGGDATITEGATLDRRGAFSDPDAGDSWTATVNYGDGTPTAALVSAPDMTFTLDHVYLDNGTFTVTVAITDSKQAVGTGSFTLTVNNVAPVLNLGGNASIAVAAMLSRSGSFVDPGADSWSGSVNYGDGGGLSSLSLRPDKAFDLIHRYARPGEYTVAVTIADDELASDTRTFVVTVLPSTVQGRHVFYNGSSFDGGEVTANAADDAATAPDKSPLLPGSQATSANYTNYSRGLNGIFVDITGLVELPTPADFELRVGNDNNPSGWATRLLRKRSRQARCRV